MDAQEFCRFIWHTYWEHEDCGILERVLAPEISVIGTGSHEFGRNLEEIRSQARAGMMKLDGPFQIHGEWYQTTPLGGGTDLVIGAFEVRQISGEPLTYNSLFRFTMVVRDCGPEGWRLVHVHRSVPDPAQMKGESYPCMLVKQSNRKLKEMLEARRRELESANEKTLYYARYDYLTDLMNRPFLESEVQGLMEREPFGIMMMMDVDDFKQVNDRHGHPFGDKVLGALAESLKAAFSGCLTGRIGGDEFLVYTGGGCLDVERFLRQAAAFRADWDERQSGFGLDYRIGVCMGIALYPQHGSDYESLWHNADKALYISKRSGKSAVAFADGRALGKHL